MRTHVGIRKHKGIHREPSLKEVRLLGLEPKTYGLKGFHAIP